MKKACASNRVSFHYTFKTNDGISFSSKESSEPLQIVLGDGAFIPKVEDAIEGMELNEIKSISVAALEAFGEWREDRVVNISRTNIAPEIELLEGLELVSKSQDGQEVVVKVLEIKDDTVLVDSNHPLAGKDLEFEIEITEITE